MSKIVTTFEYPPIPIRDYDWSAYREEDYDEDCIIGRGRTELDAIKDLIRQEQDLLD